MKINILFAFLFGILILSVPHKVLASQKAAGTSAALLTSNVAPVQDTRAKALESYLKSKGSPLADYAQTFVTEADKNDIDWKLVAAISGVESYYGQAYPHGSYNGWGWGIYGKNSHAFMSWNDAIVTISHGLRTNYMNKWGATDVYSIGHIYAADPAWAYKVTHFMNDIEQYETQYQNKSLPISL